MERQPDCYRYSRFCELYRGWASRILVTMRQTHAGGDKLFVDYAGDAVPVISTASSTTPVVSISPATACAVPDRDQPQRID
jgi:transposase